MGVHAGGDRAEAAEGAEQIGLVGLMAGEEVEEHGTAGLDTGCFELLDEAAVGAGDGGGGGDAGVVAEGLHPVQLAEDSGRSLVVGAVDAEDAGIGPAGGINAECGVLRVVEQRDGGVRGEAVAGEGGASHGREALEEEVVGEFVVGHGSSWRALLDGVLRSPGGPGATRAGPGRHRRRGSGQ